MNDAFFEKKKEWSRWKHLLLHNYLAQFAGILGSKHRVIYFVDGFAGEGRYGDPPEDGSPRISAKIAADAAAQNRTYRIKCINIEASEAVHAKLVTATDEFGSDIVENRLGTFREHLDSVLSTIGTAPALFFLDPFGTKGMEWSVVSRIARRSSIAVTEVLLNFYSSKIDRDGGRLDSDDVASPAFIKNLDAHFGTADWRALYNATPSK